MPSITLYSIPGSPPCRSVLMVLEILGLEVKIETLNPLAGDTLKPEFVEKNQLHTIPLLEEGDFILCNSHAIVTYLVSKYGAEHRATLYPNDLRIKATVDQRLYFDTETLFPRIRAISEALFKDKAKEVPEDLKAKVEEAYGFVEKYLESSQYLATDHVTIADIVAIASVSTMNVLVPLDEKYVKVHEWWNSLKQHDWYQKGNGGLAMYEKVVKSVLQPSQSRAQL